ncbi:Major Facilitator Superfamily transporter [Beggiatoa alba B18LD]|uniref:Major Facilitator Superfamily transporter n=1 Tax=Beggiatoa alba B18LD TaxID=395493 RepID=I3CF52_9GAMM|nr:MFS transporter [Beggiatoa alba]EIJ42245.1 Major Facilitator Superfamily transporter [Beggiatoa alba B18LD]
MPTVPHLAAVYLAIVQFCFASMWTIYVIYLPQLLVKAGIDIQWLRWILLADQLVFILMDISLGFATDKVQRALGKLGGMILGVSVLTCLSFLALPFIASYQQPSFLLILIFLWVVTSSALRVPPLVLLGKHTAKPQLPLAVALQTVGLALASSIAPYLGTTLSNVAPEIPFFISSITLLITVAGLIYVEKQLQDNSPQPDPPANIELSPTILFILACFCAGIAFQAYSSFHSIPQLLKFAEKSDLPYLIPIFWIGFNLIMFPMNLLIERKGAFPVLILSSALAAVIATITTFADSLPQLLIAQFLLGGCWGSIFTASLTASLNLGKTGKEGLVVGLWSSIFACAAFLRIGLLLSGWQETASVKQGLAIFPSLFWICTTGLLIVAVLEYRRFTEKL